MERIGVGLKSWSDFFCAESTWNEIHYDSDQEHYATCKNWFDFVCTLLLGDVSHCTIIWFWSRNLCTFDFLLNSKQTLLYTKRMENEAWPGLCGGTHMNVVMSWTRLDMNVGKQTSLTRRYQVEGVAKMDWELVCWNPLSTTRVKLALGGIAGCWRCWRWCWQKVGFFKVLPKLSARLLARMLVGALVKMLVSWSLVQVLEWLSAWLLARKLAKMLALLTGRLEIP